MQLNNFSPTIPVWSSALGSWNFTVSRRPFQPIELQHHYDREANIWQSKIERLGFNTAYERLIDMALSQNNVSEAEEALQVLDAGIGTGAMSAAFAASVITPIDLVGVDLSANMLQQAHKTLRRPKLNLETIQSDLANLPMASNRFDVVLMAHVVEHLADPMPVLRELHRVLKPSGMLIASITCPSYFGKYIQLIWRTHQVKEKEAKRWMIESGFEAPEILLFDSRSGTSSRSMGYVTRKPSSILREGRDSNEC